MPNFVLVAATTTTPTLPVDNDPRIFFLESVDRSVSIPLRGTQDRSPGWGIRSDPVGLDLAPTNVTYSPIPGGRGVSVDDVIEPERQVVLPLVLRCQDYELSFQMKSQLFDLISPAVNPEGFNLVCSSPSGVREVRLTYDSGAEGAQLAGPYVEHVVLSCTAADPIAYDRGERSIPFTLGESDPFLGGTWGSISLGSGAVADGAQVSIGSSVPTWASVTLYGPADSVLLTSSSGLRIEVPAPLLADDVLTVITDPRYRSIELNGVQNAGRLARGSRLVPIPQGESSIDVLAPGATSQTRLILTYRGGNRSLW